MRKINLLKLPLLIFFILPAFLFSGCITAAVGSVIGNSLSWLYNDDEQSEVDIINADKIQEKFLKYQATIDEQCEDYKITTIRSLGFYDKTTITNEDFIVDYADFFAKLLVSEKDDLENIIITENKISDFLEQYMSYTNKIGSYYENGKNKSRCTITFKINDDCIADFSEEQELYNLYLLIFSEFFGEE